MKKKKEKEKITNSKMINARKELQKNKKQKT